MRSHGPRPWLATASVAAGSNEIPAARGRPLKVDVVGKRVRRKGKQRTQIVPLISRLHPPLDVSLGEDRCRVRHENAALGWGMFRRVVVSCALPCLAEVQTIQPRHSVGRFRKQSARRASGAVLRRNAHRLEQDRQKKRALIGMHFGQF